MFYKLVTSKVKIVVEPGTKLVEIPKIVMEKADQENIKVHADFTLIYKMLRYKTRSCISEKTVVKPIMITIDEDGYIEIHPYEEVSSIIEKIKELNQH